LAADVVAVRLLDTQACSHIGRRLLHQKSDGGLAGDPVWRWSLQRPAGSGPNHLHRGLQSVIRSSEIVSR